MTPIEATEDITPSFIKKRFVYKYNKINNDGDFMNFKPNFEIEYKKRRNKMTHLTPKKKRKKK